MGSAEGVGDNGGGVVGEVRRQADVACSSVVQKSGFDIFGSCFIWCLIFTPLVLVELCVSMEINRFSAVWLGFIAVLSVMVLIFCFNQFFILKVAFEVQFLLMQVDDVLLLRGFMPVGLTTKLNVFTNLIE